MQSPVLKIFVSSTYLDLQPERSKVRDALDRLKTTKFIGMEFFGSRDQTTRQASLAEVDECDAYIGIFADRYGSGITEDEYRRALDRKIPCFIYFKAAPSQANGASHDAHLGSLKQEIHGRHLVSEFNNPDDLAARVTADLANWIFGEFLSAKLESALEGRASPSEAQEILDQVRDYGALREDLRARLRSAGYIVMAGEDVVQGNKYVYNFGTTPISSSLIPPPRQLRAPVADFVGRDREIKDLEDALLSGSGEEGVIVSISGIAGIGKTELALKVALRVRGRYPDAQLFVSLHGTSERALATSEAIEKCIRAFLGEAEELRDKGEEEMSRRLCSILSGKRALIVLDNASGSEQVRPFLPPPGCALIVTSPNRIVVPGVKRSVPLDALSPDKARALLSAVVPSIPPDVADRIAQLCDFLPLALRAAGSLLAARPDLEPADYAFQLEDERTRLETIGQEGVDASVAACFNLSYQELAPETAAVFRKLAVFPASFDSAAEEVVCGDPGHSRLSDLVRRSLVIYGSETKRYHLQSLVRLFAEGRLAEEERQAAASRHAHWYAGMLRTARDLHRQGGEGFNRSLQQFDREQGNLRKGQAWAQNHSKEDLDAARLCISYPVDGEDLTGLRFNYSEREQWIQAGLEAARRLNLRQEECHLLGGLGCVYRDAGDFGHRAEEIYKQQLLLSQEIPDRTEEALALTSLGAVYLYSQTNRAVELLQKALEIFRGTRNRYHEGRALNHLGNAFTLLSQYQKALECHQMRLSLAREIGDRRGEGKALNNLGNVYFFQGQLESALQLYEERVRVASEIGHRSGMASSLGNIAEVNRLLGRFSQARQLCAQALAICQELGEQYGRGINLETMANIHFYLGNVHQAIEGMNEALKIFRETANSSYEGTASSELAEMYAVLGEPRRSLDLCERAEALAGQGGSGHDRAHALLVKSTAHLKLEEPDLAANLCGEALTIFRGIGDRAGNAEALACLGAIRIAQGDSRQAVNLLNEALALSREVKIRRAESRILNELAKAHLALDDSRQAAGFHRQALEIAQDIGDRLTEGEASLGLSRALESDGALSQAAVQAEAALTVFEQIHLTGNASEARECLARLRGSAVSF